MNPPFLGNECIKHLRAAHSLLEVGGELIYVLPSGRKDKIVFDDCQNIYLGVYENEFENTTISVTILKLIKVK